MFFEPRVNTKRSDARFAVTASTKFSVPVGDAQKFILGSLKDRLVREARDGETACRSVVFSLGVPEGIADTSGNEEEYALSVGEEVFVWANTERGLIYGLSTLLALDDWDELEDRFIYDYPECPVRGYRVFVPGRENIPVFKEMIDTLTYYKYNSLILEIGGAMEYRRHPEINEKWVEFCAEVRGKVGRAAEIQNGYPFQKNSIHCDNGDGGFISQDECRELADYCRARGIEIIPECPTLSHSDYILLAHPELREREEDDYPDTYCPRHPDTYPLVFDILDEVIEVFHPRRLNIGHDECYTLAICERCRDADPVDLYVGDIARVKEYLDSRGVGTIMWGEKLLRAVGKNGHRYGGWSTPKERHGVMYCAPFLYPCADRMPEGITFLNWYWIFGAELDRVYHDRGYEMLFGNFNAIECENFRERINWGCRGGFVSNWGSFEDEYMQRNCQYYALMSTAYAFWSPSWDSSERTELDARVVREAYRRHYKGKRDLIRVTHSTEYSIPYKSFYDGHFIVDEVYMLGDYELTYSDGTTAYLPVKYGTNISTSDLGVTVDSGIPDCGGCSAYREVSGRTLPIFADGRFRYECGYENPHPEKKIDSIRYIPRPGKEEIKVELYSAEF